MTALVVGLAGEHKLSEPQQRFQRLLSQVALLSAQLTRLQDWSDRYRHAHMQSLYDSQQRAVQLQQRMVLWLHERLQGADLTAQQQRMVRQCIRQGLAQCQPTQDPQMLALADLYREDDEDPGPVEEDAQAEAQVRAWMQQQHAQAERKAAKRAARQAQRHPEAHQQAQQQARDAKTALRAIYRQLASALHPDRELDPQARERKTALMGTVNAAYERQDLTTLLRLQLEAAQVDPAQMSRLSSDKLRAMAVLLKEQVAALTQDLTHTQWRLTHELGVLVQADAEEAALVQALQAVQAAQRNAVTQLQADWARVQRDADFKRWLKEQARRAKQQARAAY